MKILLTIFACIITSCVFSQTYSDSIAKHRVEYRNDFLKDPHSPLKAKDTSFLRFFAPDPAYRIVADFRRTPDSAVFNMPTHTGKLKKYRQYGIVSFQINDTLYTLAVYQSPDLIKQKELQDYLFIPFTDLTNYITSYGGGRYLDMRLGNIKNGKVVIDFNKCYNPYCAYADGYACPIPPDANKLNVAIPAGEKNFARDPQE
ncbi:DUF1684 domain-containing protein [Chitinophagaceae bacterium MMS25-I14]